MTRKNTPDGQVKDWRSTGRRRARNALYESRVDYSCFGYNDPITDILVPCGKTSISPPKDAPKWFEEIWPLENRTVTSPLQADHIDKDFTHNEISNLAWRCPSCHKMQDQQTAVGVTQDANPHGYPMI